MPGLGVLLGPGFILYLDVSALVKKIGVVFFLVFIMGVFMVSAEESGLVVGSTTEAGSGEKSPDNPYRIEGYAPDSVTVGNEVYGVPCEPLFGNGEIQDIYDPVIGVETRYFKLITYNGLESWTLYSDGESVYYQFYYLPGLLDLDFSFQPICTHFNYNSVDIGTDKQGFFATKNVVRFRPDMSRFPDVDSWKSWLKQQYDAGTPVQFLYQLEQPVIVQHEPVLIGNVHLLSLQSSLQWVIQNVLTVIQIVALDPVLMLGISVWCFGGVVFLFRRLV